MTDVETWRPIPGADGYEASDQGQVCSVDRIDKAGNRQRGKVLAQGTSTDGYGYRTVWIMRGGRRVLRRVHVLVLEAFVGPCPAGMQTRHLNGVSDDNRVVNLAWGTPGENNADTLAHGHHTLANTTHCPADHEYTDENTYYVGHSRQCRTCRRDRDAERTVQRRGREQQRWRDLAAAGEIGWTSPKHESYHWRRADGRAMCGRRLPTDATSLPLTAVPVGKRCAAQPCGYLWSAWADHNGSDGEAA